MIPTTSRLGLVEVVLVGLTGLRSRPIRAVLSALGIAIGIATMVAVLGIGAAGQAGLLDRIARLGTNLLTVAPGQSLVSDGKATLPDTAVDMVGRIPGIRSVSATGSVPDATVRRTDRVDPRESRGISVLATRLDLPAALNGQLAAGSWLNEATSRYPAIVLGARAAQLLGVGAPGQQVFVSGQWFTVIGILQPLELAPEIDMAALVGWEAAVSRLGFDGHPTKIYTRSDEDRVTDVRDVLAATVNPQDPTSVQVSRPSDALTAQLAARNTFGGLLIGLAAVSLLVGGIGVANTMIIAVLERRQEIGLRRALGARRRQIRTQFLTEAVALSALGGVAGALAGLAVAVIYARVQGWPLVPAAAIASGTAASITLGAIAVAYPAARASRLAPTEALSSG